MMREDEIPLSIPHVHFALSELAGIERMLWAYGRYVQKTTHALQDQQRVQAVEMIRKRLAAQLASGERKEVQLFLTSEEVDVLLQAIFAFGKLIEHMFPANEGREMVMESVTLWIVRLQHIRAEFTA